MAVTYFDDFDPTELDGGGLPLPGKCQLLVAACDEKEGDKGPYLSVTFQIVAHESPKQKLGKVSYNTLNLSGKGAIRALKYARACGLVTQQDLAAAKASGSGIDIDYTKSLGAVIFATLEASTYNGKPKCRVEWDFRALSDPEAGSYPCSADFPRPAKAATPLINHPTKSATAPTPPPAQDEIPF